MKHSLSHIIFLLVPILFCASLCACSQNEATGKPTPNVQLHRYTIGSSTIVVKETSYPGGIPVQLIQLHSNESTADEVARSVSEEEGIDYLQLLNENKRLVDFSYGNTKFRFDPNRIFSTTGIVANLQLYHSYSARTFQSVSVFRDSLLHLLDPRKTIIAVHNNTDGAFTLAQYHKNKTGLVHRNNADDPDNFFITTDSTLFHRIKEKNFNVVLEYSTALQDDGSLSIYCRRNNITYVNVEAQHGHSQKQMQMLTALIEILK